MSWSTIILKYEYNLIEHAVTNGSGKTQERDVRFDNVNQIQEISNKMQALGIRTLVSFFFFCI
jgi:hypothetical protein